MSKFKLYFKRPDNVQAPLGQWKPWLPDIVVKHIKLVGVLISLISVATVIPLIRIMNSNGQLTAWIVSLIGNIDSIIIFRILSTLLALIVIFLITFIHEILHLFILIGKGDLYIFWNKSLLGFSPFSDCKMTWMQSIVCKILPFFVLSVGFYVAALFIGGVFGGLFKFIAVANLGMSGGDLLLTPFMFKIPKNAVFYGGGLWKICECDKQAQ